MKTLHLFSIIILLHISGIGLAQDTSKIALSIGGSEALMASPGFPFFIFNSNSYRIARTDGIIGVSFPVAKSNIDVNVIYSFERNFGNFSSAQNQNNQLGKLKKHWLGLGVNFRFKRNRKWSPYVGLSGFLNIKDNLYLHFLDQYSYPIEQPLHDNSDKLVKHAYFYDVNRFSFQIRAGYDCSISNALHLSLVVEDAFSTIKSHYYSWNNPLLSEKKVKTMAALQPSSKALINYCGFRIILRYFIYL